MALRAVHLCSGFAGFELAFKLAGLDIRTVGHVERDSHAAATLVARMEETLLDQAPVWDDLSTFDGAAWRGRVDLVTAGFPCQPWSSAGRRRGVDDDRWLWPHIARIVGDMAPRFVFLENVPDLNHVRWDRAGLPHILQDLADLGFDAEWGCLAASAVGATQHRKRLYLLAHRGSGQDVGFGHGPRRTGSGHRWTRSALAGESDPGGAVGFPPTPDDDTGWDEWIAAGGPEPQVRRGPDGRPVGLADAIHLGGNGLVPLACAHALRLLARRAATAILASMTTGPDRSGSDGSA